MRSIAFFALAVGAASTAFANPVNVQTELSLLVDISGSISTNEYNLQRQGYANAFSSAAVKAKVAQANGGIAVNMVLWSGATQQSQVVQWTHLQTAADCDAFAAAILNNTNSRPFNGLTAVGSAMNFAGNQNTGNPLTSAGIFHNNFNGARKIIDISSDGQSNEGLNPAAVRNQLAAAGITQINVLAIENPALVGYFQTNVQYGAGSFVNFVSNFNDFAAAIEGKILTELTVIPLPTAGGLACAGIMILGVRRRRTA